MCINQIFGSFCIIPYRKTVPSPKLHNWKRSGAKNRTILSLFVRGITIVTVMKVNNDQVFDNCVCFQSGNDIGKDRKQQQL